MPTQSFYIIDGHAQIYRAYFAPFRDLTSPTGEPTKGTFVFTQWLLNLIEHRKPDYLAMVIDQGGDESVFRKAIYPEYKANRNKRPDDFGPQEDRILQIVRDAGIPIFGVNGFEADDLLATMAKRLCQADFETFLVSKDKDLRQLVGPCVKMYDMAGDKVIDAAVMEAELGFGPHEAVEIQTLMGDSTDNVPGIPGVGPKTAVELIKKYKTADNVLNHLSELKPKQRENFEKYADRLPIARQLVTLKDDVEFDFDPEACKFHGLNKSALKTHLQTLGFNNLLRRISGDDAPLAVSQAKGRGKQATAGASASAKPQAANLFSDGLFGPDTTAPEANGDGTPIIQHETCASCDYQLIDTEEKLDAFVAELAKQPRFAFDTETDDLGAMRSNLVGMSFSWRATTGYYVPVKGPAGCTILPRERVLAAIKPILEDERIKKVGHNLKYDLMVMRQAGLDVKGIELDTMIAAFLIDSSRMQYGIDRLALDLLNIKKVATVELIGKGKTQRTMDCVELNAISRYASEDADVAWRLYEFLHNRLEQLPTIKKLGDELETPLIEVLATMETNGIAVDPAVLKEQSEVLGVRIDELRERIYVEAGGEFNPDSPKQLQDVLFNRLGLRTAKKTKTGFSTDVQVLERLASEHPVPRMILDYRSMVKLKNTYLDNLTEYINPVTGRIHSHFNQTGAGTGRLSSSDPNLQNIPIRTDEGRRIRSAFVPGDPARNVLLTADYSQIELRILAHFTGEPGLVKAFAEDEDIHQAVAAEVFNVPLTEVTRQQRGYAKTINFGIIYGVSAFGLSQRIEGLSVAAAGELIAAYHKRFPGINEFFKKCVAEAHEKGYVETISGRRRPIPDIASGVIAQRNYAERAAINSVVQGSAADLIKLAMLHVHKRLTETRSASRMLLQVHDELVFETPQAVVEAEAALVRDEMTKAMTLRVPLKVEVGWGKNWQEVK
jgi:DNA polymerase-1